MTMKRIPMRRSTADRKYNRTVVVISNMMLMVGSLLIVLSLGYLLVNLKKTDFLVNPLMPVLFGGIALLIGSQLICPFQFRSRR